MKSDVKWIWGYKYNHAGVREQKRILTGPHGDEEYIETSKRFISE